MKKIILFFCLITAFSFSCFAEEGGKEEGGRKGIDGTAVFQPVRKGDKFMKIGLSLGIPLFNTSIKKFAHKTNIYPGGAINAGFGYYVLDGFSLGGNLSFQFYPTLAKNLYFCVPITFDMAYTFASGKWRFPIGGGIGGVFQSYSGNSAKYFGMIFKAETGVYYQYFPEWSFGGSLSWNVLPQWYSVKEYNRTGNIFMINFAARYHF
ncbi:TP0733 family outer membrane beta-barrel protein [Treponema pedis]|uniref:TP0733 family outer membrane beta-barrel protein n=1 Tax=Treponema pedis TaxID=409322 RepID=UPI00197EA640|nr:hypothetical protein [Treponema pedis]QSI04769.1 hypothetical protein DYQ05_07395 [Treponema pedis]